MIRRRVSIRTGVILAALLVTAPLVGLAAWQAYDRFASDERSAEADALGDARAAATHAASFIADASALLARIADRPLIVATDPARCDPILSDLALLPAAYANVTLFDRTGRAICPAVPLPDEPPPGADQPWFRETVQQDGFTISAPLADAITRRSLIVLALPVHDSSGALAGVLAAPMDLVEFGTAVIAAHAPPGATITLVDGSGTVLTRFPDPERWIGASVRDLEIGRAALAGESGALRARGLDGVERLYGYAPVAGTDWRVYSGIDAQLAFAAARGELAGAATLILLTILLVLALALLAGRFIARPCNDLEAAFAAVASGKLDTAVRVTGFAETAALAERFNEMTARRAAAEEALRASEERFRILVESSPNAILLVDRDGRIVLANGRIEGILGYTPEELIGTSVEQLVPVELRARHLGDRLAYLQAPRVRTMAAGRSLAALRRDGTSVPVDIALSPITVAGELHVLATIADTTERRRLEEQLLQSQRLEAIGHLAGGIAHDFNNLVNVIAGFGRLVLDDLPEDEPHREDVEQILAAADRAATLTRQLLAFARRQVLQPRVLNLNEVVADITPMLARILGEDTDLVTMLAPNLGAVRADPGQLEQVIVNLAVNARDAMPEGGRLTIETANVDLDESFVRSRVEMTPGSYVVLAVSDTGHGMTEEVRQRIFEPFFTTKPEGHGTGLGLSTTYGIVRQSGGFISVYSEPGQGTTFRIYLPRVAERAEPFMRPPRTRAADVGVETLLLVEDDEAGRTYARRVLEARGYQVLAAAHGPEALEVAAAHDGPIDLLVTDVIMPGMSGRELADRLVASRPGLRVLYVSGYTENSVVHHGHLEEGVAFLVKPYSPDDLARKVREVLDADEAPRH